MDEKQEEKDYKKMYDDECRKSYRLETENRELREFIKAQGGDLENMKLAPKVFSIKSPRSGIVNKIDALIKDELTSQDVFQYIQYYLKSKQLVSTFCCNAIEEDDLQQLQTFICTS